MPDLRLPHLPENLELPALIRRLNRYLGAPQGGSVTLTDVIVGTATFTSTLQFDPDNTLDVGYVAALEVDDMRPRYVTAATALRVGHDFAQSGQIRLENNASMAARNGAGSADIELIGLTSGDVVEIGGAGADNIRLQVGALGTTTLDASLGLVAVTGDLTVSGDGEIDGNLGVGRTPTLDLDVVGQFGVSPSGVAFPTVLARGIDGRFYTVHDIGDWGFVVARAANDDFAANLTLYHTRDAAGGRTALVNGDGVARITFQGVSQTGGTVTVGAAILATVTGTVSNGVLPTELTFHTAASGDADLAVERMALTSAGHWIPGANGSYDLGSSSFRMRSGYFGTELVTPSLDSGGAVDLVLQRNNVTQLTLGSSAATFVGTVQGTTLTGTTRITSPLLGTTTNVNVVFDRNSVTQLTLGSLSATFAGDLTVAGDNLNVNGLTYTWPSSQSTNRVLKNTGPGTLAWSQVDLTTDITGIIPSANVSGDYPNITGIGTLVSGAVPASLVTAGTFGAGAYTFPSTLTVTSTLTQNGTIASLAQGASGSVTIGAAASTQSDLIIRGAAATQRNFWLYTGNTARWNGRANVTAETGSDAGSNYDFIAYNDAGSQIDIVYRITRAANGSIAFASNRPITGGTYNGQTISSAASFTGSLSTAGALNINSTGTSLNVGTAAGGAVTGINIRAAASIQRDFIFSSGTTAVWTMRVQDTESGGDAGASLNFIARTDAGAIIDVPLSITRAAGGTIAFASARPITGGTYNGQTISSAASFTGTVAVASTLNVTGNLNSLSVGSTFGTNAGASQTVALNSAAGGARLLAFRTAGANRWIMGVTSTAESGSDAGSNFTLNAHTDAGSAIDSPLTIARVAGGTIAFASGRPVTMGSSLAITGALSGVTTLAISSDVTYSDASWLLSPNTVDGADTSRAFFSAGGGTASVGRGAYVGVSGNENATSPGILFLVAGDTGFIRTLGNFIPNNDGADDLGSASFQYNRLYLDNQLISSLATGTAPFVVASTTKVANLNADLLDDQTGSYYLDLANATGTLDETLGGTGLTTYTLGDILYASAANTLSKLAGNTSTTGMYLKQTGTGAASAAPVWDTLTAADVGAGSFSGSFSVSANFTVNGNLSMAGNISFQASGSLSSSVGALTLISASGQIECADDIDLASGQVLRVNGTQVVGARETGWATSGWAGTPARTAFDTASVTLPQLAAVVQAILEDLGVEGHGAFDVDVDA